MNSLENQVVIVIGGTSGIGFAAAQACAAEGARVTVAGRTLARAEAAARSLGAGATALAIDMRDPAGVTAALSAFERIDHLVVTAVGDEYAFAGHPAALTDEQVELSLEKLRGYIRVARASSSRLASRGSMTLLSGAGALKPPRGASLAAAANGGIISFARGLAVDLAPARVNVVVPGPVETSLHGARLEQVRAWTQTLPAAHFGQPADIAHAILFLLTNPYVTGSTLAIDGGYTIS